MEARGESRASYFFFFPHAIVGRREQRASRKTQPGQRVHIGGSAGRGWPGCCSVEIRACSARHRPRDDAAFDDLRSVDLGLFGRGIMSTC